MGKRFYHFMCGVIRPYYSLVYPVRIEGLENLPPEGACIVCANHLHARDPIYLAVRIRRRMLHFMAKAELFKWKPLAAILKGLEAFPVDRGHNDLNAVRTALKLLSDGHVLGVFPQGTRSRTNERLPMLSGISLIALRAGKPVIPVFIGGPYRLFRRTPVRIGAPVDLSDLGRKVDGQTLEAATRRIEDAVWALRDAP
ncbi:MAG: 1-acyl-sn-glycerol-3-phosphate acyltransferase [Clostridia bacterium]|nr:1-acyl-sn-glycerol-3-phosphate acyltransferase [Clostridia bacterium]